MGLYFRHRFPVFIHVCHNPRLLVGQMVGHKGKIWHAKPVVSVHERLSRPGRYADGGNLYLLISPNGGKRWTFFYRFGKDAGGRAIRREMGLGSAAKDRCRLQKLEGRLRMPQVPNC